MICTYIEKVKKKKPKAPPICKASSPLSETGRSKELLSAPNPSELLSFILFMFFPFSSFFIFSYFFFVCLFVFFFFFFSRYLNVKSTVFRSPPSFAGLSSTLVCSLSTLRRALFPCVHPTCRKPTLLLITCGRSLLFDLAPLAHFI
jgi:hypothetical protein